MRVWALIFTMLLPATAVSQEDCYSWPLREKNGALAYDGDTIYVTLTDLPAELSDMSVRVLGIDAPERGWRADCPGEMELGRQATLRINELLEEAGTVTFCNVDWDKYGGRFLADVFIDGNSIAATLLEERLVREYDGETRLPWCDGDELVAEFRQ